ncbi:hypothetical protein JCM4814A_12690 [Streptomyces phaeofaciens JCM 4814]|uniref:Uncharacterized protein n=1 Tax=Streptomyces phaeofaciens TaxID=68254 RepID=A0A918LWQ2_9ACTN|nr:hypothetical protein GCM10010226_43210 [Streptomyces phaeofaciens]
MRGTRDGAYAARGGSSPPRRTPDFNRLPPLAVGLSGKLPPAEGTGDSCYRSPVSGTAHQSPRDEELDVNFRTM